MIGSLQNPGLLWYDDSRVWILISLLFHLGNSDTTVAGEHGVLLFFTAR